MIDEAAFLVAAIGLALAVWALVEARELRKRVRDIENRGFRRDLSPPVAPRAAPRPAAPVPEGMAGRTLAETDPADRKTAPPTTPAPSPAPGRRTPPADALPAGRGPEEQASPSSAGETPESRRQGMAALAGIHREARTEPLQVQAGATEPRTGERAGAPDTDESHSSVTTLEERLGARIFVWIGAIALTLAGGYLVKYTFDQGLLSPLVRVGLGVGFGVVMLGLGEWLRTRLDRIAQGLTAAGVAVLFTSLLAAVNLYELISPFRGFLLLAGVTALAVLLSLRQGPFVAGLGMIGGFLTPVMMQVGEPGPGLFGYLFLLQLGLVLVTRRRAWWMLTGLTLLGSMAWAVTWLLLWHEPGDSWWLGMFLLGTVGLFVVGAEVGPAPRVWGSEQIARGLTVGAAGLGMLVGCLLVATGDYTTIEWLFLGLLGAGCVVLGRLRDVLIAMPWLAAGLSAAMLLAWANTGVADTEVTRFRLTVLCLGGLYAMGAYACLWGSGRPGNWTSLSVGSAIVFLLVAWVQNTTPPWMDHGWGALCLALTAACVLGAVPIGRRRGDDAWADALAAMVVGAFAFVSIAVPIELEREWRTIAWAIAIPLLAAVHLWLGIGLLRPFAAALGAVCATRLLLNPLVLTYPISTHPLLNWLPYGYGIPAAAFACGAWMFRRRTDDGLVRGLEVGAILIGAALLTLMVRQGFHPGQPGASTFTLNESAAMGVAWLVYGWGVMGLSRLWPRTVLLKTGAVIACIAALYVLFVPGAAFNPLWHHAEVGETRVFNLLLPIYGLPAVLFLLVAREIARVDASAARVLGVGALWLAFLLVSLQVRQAFQGTYLDGAVTTDAERYAYSVAWIVFGAALLLGGVITRGVVLRYASLAVMLVTVGKVFIFDTAHLRDLYRVFSFLGLGVSLLVLAWIYQRFVFRPMRRPAAGA